MSMIWNGCCNGFDPNAGLICSSVISPHPRSAQGYYNEVINQWLSGASYPKATVADSRRTVIGGVCRRHGNDRMRVQSGAPLHGGAPLHVIWLFHQDSGKKSLVLSKT